MKGSYIQLDHAQNSLGLVPCRIKTKKYFAKPECSHDLDLIIPESHSVICQSKQPLTIANMNVYCLKNTYKDKRKIKDAVTVKKMNLFCKENVDNRKMPALLNIIKRNSLNLSGGIEYNRRISQKGQSKIVKKTSIFPDYHLGLRTFTSPMSPCKQVSGKGLRLQKLEKESQISQTLFQTKPVVANTKSQALINIKLKNYLSFIKEGRKLHNLTQQLNKQPRKKALKVKIKKGNNSQLVKWLFKKRWWWTIQDQKDCKEKSRPNFIWCQLKDKSFFDANEAQQINMESSTQSFGDLFAHNHFPLNQYLGNKKALFYNMSNYYKQKNIDVFQKLPLTYHVVSLEDQSWKNFTQKFQQNKKHGLSNIWILKPGENSNRGRGITVHESYEQMKNIVGSGQTFVDNHDQKIKQRTYIIQAYIDKPFLYNKRKFDIRCYMLLVNINKTVKGYWYSEGYIRTSSFEFQLHDFNTFVHLTNDAIQTHSQNYGKYEDGNKISYAQFQKYLDTKFTGCDYDLEKQIIPQMKQIATESIKAAIHIVKGKNESKPVFEVFGLDFMIDKNFKPWLIQINTNPCIQTSCLVLEKVIPRMLDDAFKLSLDILFPPPENWPCSRKYCLPTCQNRFQLVYQESKEQQYQFNQADFPSLGVITQDGEVYDENEQ